jgi:hypothetical protein
MFYCIDDIKPGFSSNFIPYQDYFLTPEYISCFTMQWMPLVEFVEQPLIREDHMFKKIIDICIARLGKRYCGLSAHKVVSKFDGMPSSLYYNDVETQDSNCTGS